MPPPHLAVVQTLEYAAQARHVERVVEALPERLGHDRELGLAADRLEERVRLEPLQIGGRPLAAIHARDEERTDRALTEARAEQRRADQRLAQERVDLLGRDEGDQPLGVRRDLARRERQENSVVHVARLGDEAGAPQLLLQDHAPGAVDAHAEDRVDHRVAAAHLVRERLDDDPLIVGDAVENLTGLDEPGPHRRGRPRVEAADLRGPLLELRRVDALGGIAAQPPDREAQLPRAGRVLAPPERNRRRHPLGVLDQDAIGADLDDLPRVRAEQEDVAREALRHELLVERADLQVGLGDEDVVEAVVGNGASGGERQEPAAPARVQPVVHAVPQNPRRGALDLGR